MSGTLTPDEPDGTPLSSASASGPGDPDYMTVRATRILPKRRPAGAFLQAGASAATRAPSPTPWSRPMPRARSPLVYPVTTEVARRITRTTARRSRRSTTNRGEPARGRARGRPRRRGPVRGRSVLLRLVHASLAAPRSHRFPTEVVPGVTGMSGCWTRAGAPITWGDDVLTVLPGTLAPRRPRRALPRHRRRRDHEARPATCRRCARALQRGRAAWTARSTSSAAPWPDEVVCPARGQDRRRGALLLDDPRARRGAAAVTRLAHDRRPRPRRPALADRRRRTRRSPRASDLVGYGPYLDRVPARRRPAAPRLRQPRRARARAPRPRPRGRRRAAWRSSRAAIPASSPWRRRCSRRWRPAIPAWRRLAITVEPGITAMLAAAARARRAARRRFLRHVALGQPQALGGRHGAALQAVLAADFVIALYNPISVGAALAARRGPRAGGGDPRRPRRR